MKPLSTQFFDHVVPQPYLIRLCHQTIDARVSHLYHRHKSFTLMWDMLMCQLWL